MGFENLYRGVLPSVAVGKRWNTKTKHQL